MGNEASRSSRHSNGSSPLRRSSRRNSKSKTLNGGQQYIAEDDMDPRATQQQDLQVATPKPVKRMEKIRRSLSFRRKKKSDKQSSKYQQQTTDSTSPTANLTSSVSAPINILNNNQNNNNSSSSAASASVSKSNSTTTQAIVNSHPTNTSNTTTTTITNTNNNNNNNNSNSNNNSDTTNSPPVVNKPPHWMEDEKRVRAGNCSFQVKYLGCTEVSDSRGMHLCELAIEKLISEKDKKKPVKAILYVSGDSLRVVDEGNKTLLVDQTIEKVSFCAPDRHHENGFAYICRDGTTRRWLCHCFMATKDTLKNSSSAVAGAGSGCSGGERLSHAVGCAFSVCLEKKQKRERENVTMEVGPNHSFTRMGSFRQASLTERLEDPQIVMPANEPVPLKPVENPHAIERPRANPDAFNRQNSLRSSALQLQFKRNSSTYASLKPGELPSFQQQKLNSGLPNSTPTTPTTTSAPLTKTSLLMQQHQLNQSINNHNTTNSVASTSSTTAPLPTTPITTLNKASLLSNSESMHNKINTISELPEEQFNPNEHVNSMNSQISPKLNEQLNVQTNLTQQFIQPLTPKPAQPTPPPLPQQMQKSQDDWPNNNNFVAESHQPNLFYNMNTSILATPQSLPVTPSPASLVATPPPLPPIPAQYTTPITALYSNPQQVSLAQNYTLFSQQHPQAPAQLYYTTNQPQLVPMMQMMQIQSPLQTQLYATPIAQPLVSSMVSPPASSAAGSANPNETFEQKWARIQAAKKTNPFAEDIAKKFEIKL